MIEARRTIIPDIPPIAASMRPEDKDEVFAATGETPYDALFHGYVGCDECFTVVHCTTREPMAMFGYTVVEKDLSAVVWLLASTRLLDHKWSFLRQSRQWVDYIQEKAPLLYNAADQRNAFHLRWLSWVGFNFIRVVKRESNVPFVEFARLRCSK